MAALRACCGFTKAVPYDRSWADQHPTVVLESSTSGGRDLAAFHPQRLWFGSFLCHYLEAAVVIREPQPLGGLRRYLLRHYSSPDQPGDKALSSLELEPGLVHRLLHEMHSMGLVERTDHGWHTTSVGQNAASSGLVDHYQRMRQTFVFLDQTSLGWVPHFLPLRTPGTALTELPARWSFDLDLLRQCILQPPAWKDRFAFPSHLTSLETSLSWKNIAIDSPRQVELALMEVPAPEATMLLGFALHPNDWRLQSTDPVLKIPRGWQDIFPDLMVEPELSTWMQAWLDWSATHELPAQLAKACSLEYVGNQLIVRGPAEVIRACQGLQQAWWLLAPGGRSRRAIRIDQIVEA